MAQKVLVSLVDDLDGSEAEETVEFGLDGVSYQIDLSGENAEELRDALAQYVEHARRAAWPQARAAASGRGRQVPGPPGRGRPRAEPGDSRVGPQERFPGFRPRAHPVGGRRGLPQEELTGHFRNSRMRSSG